MSFFPLTTAGAQSGTNLGPLTTTWTPPAGCSVLIEAVADTATVAIWAQAWQAQSCQSLVAPTFVEVADNPNCWPPRDPSLSGYTTPLSLNGWGYYSPGYDCPVGYTTACVAGATSTAAVGTVDVFGFQFELSDGEMAVGCCPTGGYQCAIELTGDAQSCLLIATTGTFTAARCIFGTTASQTVWTLPTAPLIDQADKIAETVSLWAPLFQLNRVVVPMTSSSTSTALLTGSSTFTAPTNTGTNTDETPTTTGYDGLPVPSIIYYTHRLSLGQSIGIGVGAGIGAILLLSGCAYLVYRLVKRRRRKHGVDVDTADAPPVIGNLNPQMAVIREPQPAIHRYA